MPANVSFKSLSMVNHIPFDAILLEELKVGDTVAIREYSGKFIRSFTVESVDLKGCTCKTTGSRGFFYSIYSTYWGDSVVYLSRVLCQGGLDYNGIWEKAWKTPNGIRFEKGDKAMVFPDLPQSNNVLDGGGNRYNLQGLTDTNIVKINRKAITTAVALNTIKVFKNSNDLDLFLHPGKDVIDIEGGRKKIIKAKEKEVILSSPLQSGDYVKVDKGKLSASSRKNYTIENKLNSASDFQDIFIIQEVLPFKGVGGEFIVNIKDIPDEARSSYLIKISKGEYKERMDNLKYSKIGKRFEGKIRETLQGEERNLSQLQMACIQKAREVLVLEKKCDGDIIEFGKAAMEAIDAVIAKLKKDKTISSVKLHEDAMSLEIYTSDLMLKQIWKNGEDISREFGDSLPVVIGKYKIVFDLTSGSYSVSHYSCPCNIHKGHPHLRSDTRLCIGERQGAFDKALASMDFITAIRILIEALEQVNDSSRYLSLNSFWTNAPINIYN